MSTVINPESKRAPETPAPSIVPLAVGPLWARFSVQVPSRFSGKLLIAGLRHQGRLVAVAHAKVLENVPTTLDLRALDDSIQKPGGKVCLELVINRDALGWPSPSFGEYYRKEIVTLPALGMPLILSSHASWKLKEATAPENIVTIHYHRFDGAYLDVGVWSWDPTEHRNPEEHELWPVGHDEFGLVFQLDRGAYGENAETPRIGLLPRLCQDWNRKDGLDRYLLPCHGTAIYLIGGRSSIYTERPDISPQVDAVHIDAPDQVLIELTHPVAASFLSNDTVTLRDASGAAVPLKELNLTGNSELGTHLLVTTEGVMDFENKSYFADVAGYGEPVVGVLRGVLDDRAVYFPADATPGCIYSHEKSVFQVFAPTASCANLLLFHEAIGDAGRELVAMQKAGSGLWEVQVKGDLEGRFYAYSFEGVGLSPEIEVVDINATNTVDSNRRARITDLEQASPAGWQSSGRGPVVESPVDVVVYEMHVRDFTVAQNSGAEHKGLYLGFAESGTTLPGKDPLATGIDHLVELGITHVQLLPVQDFQNEESCRHYNWGYLTIAFNSPDGLYATGLNDQSRVVELKTLIQALHDRGIGVILDVVYNHTGEGSFFNATVPLYYYRMLPDGSYANGSGVGNEFRSEAPMARKYLIDSLRFWVKEYHVDGFRFDLMALIDIETMKEAERELRKIRPDILLYGEPWQAGGSPLQQLTDKGSIRSTGIGAFNDEFRNAIKGSPDGSGLGFLQRGYNRGDVEKGLNGSWRTWAPSPAHTINYMTCHDNLVLYDKLKVSRPDADEKAIIAMMKLGYFILFTSQGVPFLHGGEEFGRTKFGNHNSYEAPDSVNQVDWSLKQKNFALFEYVRKLIALRKAHPLFRLRTVEEIKERCDFHHAPTGDTILMTIDGRSLPGETWTRVSLLINGGDDVREFVLPAGSWQVAFNLNGEEQNEPFDGKVKMQRKTAVLLREA